MPPASTNKPSPLIILTGRDSFPDKKKPRQSRYSWGGNNMVPSAAWWNPRSKTVPFLDSDVQRNLSEHGRRRLLSLGRYLYFSCECIRQAVNELAEYTTATFLPEFRLAGKEWSDQAETMLYEHDRMCDIAGQPNTMRTYRRGLIKSLFVDGDGATLFVEQDGQPYLQWIPGHRICGNEPVVGGPFDGAEVIDGVIAGASLQPLGYRVLTGDGSDATQYQDIPATSMMLHFDPDLPGQMRGISKIGIAAWSILDLSEARRFELLAQKAGAGRVFQEWNEEGQAPIGSDMIVSPSTSADGSGTASGLWREVIDEGINTYFKSNTDSRIEAVKFDRPTSNQQAFTQMVMRDILGAFGTSYDFVTDPTRIGGNSSRVMLEKMNRNIRSLQDIVIEPAVRRFDAYRIGYWISKGMLPAEPNWWAREYSGPKAWSGDRRYEAEATLLEVRAGVTPRSRWASANSESIQDVLRLNAAHITNVFKAAQAISTATGVPFETCLAKLEGDGVQFNTAPQTEDPKPESP